MISLNSKPTLTSSSGAIAPSASVVFRNVAVSPVTDGAYGQVVLELLRSSQRTALCGVFIVDHGSGSDPLLRVDNLLLELAAATWRGVDARVLIGGSRSNRSIERATVTAHARARELGVDCRLVAAARAQDLHAKLVVGDDWALLGSHNWSAGAISGNQTQDSVLLRGTAVAASLAEYFEGVWAATPEGDYDVAL